MLNKMDISVPNAAKWQGLASGMGGPMDISKKAKPQQSSLTKAMSTTNNSPAQQGQNNQIFKNPLEGMAGGGFGGQQQPNNVNARPQQTPQAPPQWNKMIPGGGIAIQPQGGPNNFNRRVYDQGQGGGFSTQQRPDISQTGGFNPQQQGQVQTKVSESYGTQQQPGVQQNVQQQQPEWAANSDAPGQQNTPGVIRDWNTPGGRLTPEVQQFMDNWNNPDYSADLPPGGTHSGNQDINIDGRNIPGIGKDININIPQTYTGPNGETFTSLDQGQTWKDVPPVNQPPQENAPATEQVVDPPPPVNVPTTQQNPTETAAFHNPNVAGVNQPDKRGVIQNLPTGYRNERAETNEQGNAARAAIAGDLANMHKLYDEHRQGPGQEAKDMIAERGAGAIRSLHADLSRNRQAQLARNPYAVDSGLSMDQMTQAGQAYADNARESAYLGGQLDQRAKEFGLSGMHDINNQAMGLFGSNYGPAAMQTGYDLSRRGLDDQQTARNQNIVGQDYFGGVNRTFAAEQAALDRTVAMRGQDKQVEAAGEYKPPTWSHFIPNFSLVG